MSLDKAIEVLKEIYKNTKFEDSRSRVALAAIYNYIENESIPKEKVKNLISKIDNKLNEREFQHDMYMVTEKYENYLCLVATRKHLQELLGEWTAYIRSEL